MPGEINRPCFRLALLDFVPRPVKADNLKIHFSDAEEIESVHLEVAI